jgi:hypothetical protein
MKLSEILDKYYVMALNCTDIVGFHFPSKEEIIITFKDLDSNEVYQIFVDQEPILLDHPTGGFFVTDYNEQQCGFIALNGVDLNEST